MNGTDARASLAKRALPGLKENRAFYEGDHWQASTAWIGPRPAVGEVGGAEVLSEIQRALISKNAIREVITRHAGAVIGQEPAWSFTLVRALADGEEPTPDEQALIDEAEAALTVLWDARRLHQDFQQAVAILLYAGRAALRLYVPSGLLNEAGAVVAQTLPDALAVLYLDVPKPEQAGLVTDRATQRQTGVYAYTTDDGGDRVEVVSVDLTSGATLIQISGGENDERAPVQLGGRLTICELSRDPLITPQVRQQQMLLNLAKTMLARNVVLGGFLERIILNAQLPGEYVEDAVTKKKTFVPSPLKTGAGTTNVLAGLPVSDASGRVTGYATPTVMYRDPVPVTTFNDTADAAYQGMLEEVHQLHAAIAGDATASGESRRQARADFEASLGATISEVEAAGRWLLETALAMAAAFANQPGRFDSLRATFTCRVDSGPISADEQKEARENVAAGLLSKETGMVRVGIDDVDAEKTKIAAESETANQAQQTNATAILGRAGLLAQQVRSDGQATAQAPQDVAANA